MRHAVLLTLCLAVVATAGGSKPAVRIIDGKRVLARRQIQPQPVIEVRHLAFFACEQLDTGADCTVVTGTFISHLPKQFFEITVNVHLFRISGTGVEEMGVAVATITEPAPEKPIRFVALGSPIYFPEVNGKERRTGHYVSFDIKPHNPK